MGTTAGGAKNRANCLWFLSIFALVLHFKLRTDATPNASEPLQKATTLYT